MVQIRGYIPKSHIRFLERALLALEVDDTLFVHSGLDWMRPLTAQSREDALWSRNQLHNHNFGRFVVHGHTPNATVTLRPHFGLNIDTGCAYNGRYGQCLTCVELTEGTIIQVDRDTGNITRSKIDPFLLRPLPHSGGTSPSGAGCGALLSATR